MLTVDTLQQPSTVIDAGRDDNTSSGHLQAILAEATRLIEKGFRLLPLGAGPDGKAPSVRWAGRAALGVRAFERKMTETRSTMYGIRLEGMVVLDCDVRDQALIQTLEHRFGMASVKVQSARGIHLYYADADRVYPDLRREGYPVDVKRGGNQYVVGSGSVRPDGAVYVAVLGTLGETTLCPLCDSALGRSAAGQRKQDIVTGSDGLVQAGSRHAYLTRCAVQFAPRSETEEELFENLRFSRDESCSDPSSVSDAELRDLAKWAFERQQQGRLYGAAGGYTSVPRRMIDALVPHPDALALYMRLLATHSCRDNPQFGLSYEGMMESGLINMSGRAFRKAVQVLRDHGAICVAAEYSAGKRIRQFRLSAL